MTMDELDNRTKNIDNLLKKTRYALITLRSRDKVYERLLEERLNSLEQTRLRKRYATEKDIRNVREMFHEILSLKEYTSESLDDRMARQKHESDVSAQMRRDALNRVSFIAPSVLPSLASVTDQRHGYEASRTDQRHDSHEYEASLTDQRHEASLTDQRHEYEASLIDQRHEVDEDIHKNTHESHECQYGKDVGGGNCKFFPCVTPPTYRCSMGITKLLSAPPLSADVAILKHVKDGLSPSGKDPYTVTLAGSGSTAPPKSSRLLSTRAKEYSLNKVMNEIKRHNLERKPKCWNTNYGKPMPLRLLHKPPRVKTDYI